MTIGRSIPTGLLESVDGTIDRNEEGLTLIELIISILILGIIMAPLFSSMVIGLASTEQASQLTANSTDQQVVASFFVNDVQSAADVSTTSTCGGAGAVVQFHWVDPVDGKDKVAAYVRTATSELQRVYCENGVSVKTSQLVGALGATGPTVECDGAACSTANPGSTPRAVSMTVTETGSTSSASRETYSFTVAATRRTT